MDPDDVLIKAEKAIQASRKVIANAEAALRRTDDYFRERGINPETLKLYLKKHANPTIQREIEMMAEQQLEEVRKEAEQAVREAQAPQGKAPRPKRFRSLI